MLQITLLTLDFFFYQDNSHVNSSRALSVKTAVIQMGHSQQGSWQMAVRRYFGNAFNTVYFLEKSKSTFSFTIAFHFLVETTEVNHAHSQKCSRSTSKEIIDLV